jgi:hypothetical protein
MTPFRIATRIALLACTTAAAAGAHGDDGACQPMLAAQVKLATTPSHQYSTQTASFLGNKTRESETVVVGNAMWVRVAGKWQALEYNAARTIQELQMTSTDTERRPALSETHLDSSARRRT